MKQKLCGKTIKKFNLDKWIATNEQYYLQFDCANALVKVHTVKVGKYPDQMRTQISYS